MANASIVMDQTIRNCKIALFVFASTIALLLFVLATMSVENRHYKTRQAFLEAERTNLYNHIEALKSEVAIEKSERKALELQFELEVKRRIGENVYNQQLEVQQQLLDRIIEAASQPLPKTVITGDTEY